MYLIWKFSFWLMLQKFTFNAFNNIFNVIISHVLHTTTYKGHTIVFQFLDFRHNMSRCLFVCNVEGRKGLLSSRVCVCTEWHRLCTTPSLLWPGGILIYQYHLVDGGAESLSLSVSEVSSLLQTGGAQLLFQPQASQLP